MTAEQFAAQVEQLIVEAKAAGLDEDEIATELEGILAEVRGE